jgi:16S rRNA (adenine1518-N6/adenine1519-N6)-dimethyltransferase
MTLLKKKWGQHLLQSDVHAGRIVNYLLDSGVSFEAIIEVGPGRGMLSEIIRQKTDIPYYMFEIDPDMRQWLINKKGFKPDQVMHTDFLEFNADSGPWADRPIAVIGNFPYNISAPIFFKILEFRAHISVVVGMFQKEVARRFTAEPGSKTYGLTSVLASAFYQREYLFSLSPGAFIPPPKVDSGVIRLVSKGEVMDEKTEKVFRSIVKKAFGNRRKMLSNTIKDELVMAGGNLLAIAGSNRPEQLHADEFITIAKAVVERNSR